MHYKGKVVSVLKQVPAMKMYSLFN